MGTLDAARDQAAWKQLERIVTSSAFSGAPRLSSLLRYIVSETLAGRGDQLKEYRLAIEALGRAVSFDPRLDSIVRVEASKLRSRLAAYYKEAGANDPVLIELPRGSYAVRIASREWSAQAPPVRTVAVLPFVNHGPDTDAEYLADGLTEELIGRLGIVPTMRVVARTSAFQFKGNAGNIRDIGRVLGASYVIEGSVRKAADRLRVNARLIDAESGYQLWSRTFDETIDDILGVQITIAAAIGTAFGAHVPLPPQTTAHDGLRLEAYQAYLRGRFHRSQWTLQSIEKSIECFQFALASEPNSPALLGALSEACTIRAMLGDLAPAKHLASARDAAQRAIAIDEACAHAHLSLGWIHHLYDWQWASGQAEFERAIQLNPSFAEAYHLKGIFLALRRRIPEAEESFARALELDPLSLVIRTHTAMVPYFSGSFADAESRLAAAIDMDPRFPEAHWVLGLTYDSQGNYKGALEEFQRAIDLGGENPTLIADTAFVHIRLGELQAAHEILARLEDGFPRPHPAASSVARIYLALGERDKSNTWLGEAFESRDAMLPWACSDPRYKDLWTLPALSAFRQRMIAESER